MYIKDLRGGVRVIGGAQTNFEPVRFKDGVAKVSKAVGEALIAKYPEWYGKASAPRKSRG